MNTPVLDHALAHLGTVDGLGIVLAMPGDVSVAALAARLRERGARVFDADAAPDVPSYILGAASCVSAEHLGATTYGARFAQTVPVVDLSGSALMQLAHDRIGIGQASVLALLDITNLQLAGRRIVVCGYGPVGQGVAHYARALGGRVTVVETDPTRAANALLAGHHAERFAAALPGAEVVFVTDAPPHLGAEHINHLCDGTILAAAGAQAMISPEIVAFGDGLRAVRAHVEAFNLPPARDVKRVAEGLPLHLAAGQGMPAEASDIVLALHISGLAQLRRGGENAPPRAGLDPAVEAALATLVVGVLGGTIEL